MHVRHSFANAHNSRVVRVYTTMTNISRTVRVMIGSLVCTSALKILLDNYQRDLFECYYLLTHRWKILTSILPIIDLLHIDGKSIDFFFLIRLWIIINSGVNTGKRFRDKSPPPIPKTKIVNWIKWSFLCHQNCKGASPL